MPRPLTLSYALNRKTDKLLKAHQDKGRGMAIMIPVGAIAGLLWVYFLGNMDRYLSSWSSLFSNNMEPASLLTPMEGVFVKVLLVTTVAFGFVYVLWSKQNEKYKKMKIEILEILKIEPCYHRYPCDCVDEYCEWLELEKGVDLL